MNRQHKNDLYRPYRVDLGGDVFTVLRAARGITYDDALQGPADKGADARTLFMPGCALASYAPELTHAVYGYLRDTGKVDGLSVTCCGNILAYAAAPEERQHYDERLAARLEEHRVRRIVTGCSNCYHAFTELTHSGKAPRLEVVALSEVLVQQGLRFSPSESAPFKSVCIHDSCPDRGHSVFARSVRTIFEQVEVREMAHSHEHSLCCGLGKLLGVEHADTSFRLSRSREAEFAATGASCLVTYCATCAQALVVPGDAGTRVHARHYLELLFDVGIDWAALDAATAAAGQASAAVPAVREAPTAPATSAATQEART
jgi:Fe-S oxidoreductase